MNPYETCSMPNFWLSCILLDRGCKTTPDEIRRKLESYNVESRLIWRPMHMQPVYESNDFIASGDEYVGKDIFERGLCLPSDLKMTEDVQNSVIEIIKQCFN